MDFFGLQDEARRATRRLVVFFALAVATIVAGVYVAALFVFLRFDLGATGQGVLRELWNPELFVLATIATLAVIGGGSLYKSAQLARGGGDAVARLLGGRVVTPDTENPDERRLLNVVEEMAIAAGTPVPTVFLLERESGINAFAAGFRRDSAVIGFTRGCLDYLSRDELQGVVAHELSHVLNGDMRLNMRLMGIVHGILVLALIGYWLLRVGGRGGSARGRGKGGGASLALFGLALLVIGYAGVFFGRVIKGSVSRHREYLADASAVQFTRNPGGLAGALKKIGGVTGGSKLTTSHAEEASHFYFANGLEGLFDLLSTHPPLGERILRVDPSFDGRYPTVERRQPSPAPSPEDAQEAESEEETAILTAAVAAGGLALDPESITESVGNPSRAHVDYAAAFLSSLPPALTAEAREPFGAVSLVLALLLDADPAVRAKQLATLPLDDSALRRQVAAVLPAVDALPREGRLPLLDLSLPALQRLSTEQYARLRKLVVLLVRADDEVSLFEYVLERVLVRHLDPSFGAVERKVVQRYSLLRLASSCAVVLSALSHAGHERAEEAAIAFRAGWERLTEGMPTHDLLPSEECTFDRLDEAFDRLETVSLPRRRELLAACATTIATDGRVTIEEGELFRAVADALDCPIPPLLARRSDAQPDEDSHRV